MILSGILDQRTTTRRYLVAGGVAALIMATILAVMPISQHPSLEIPAFLPIFATTIFLVQGLTAYFLFIQFRATRVAHLGALAGAYGYVMVMAGLQILVFPGVFTQNGLLGAGPQSAIWLWVLWHGGFPVLVILALLLRATAARRTEHQWPLWLGGTLLIAGPMLAMLLAYLAIAQGGVLPPLVLHGSYATLRQSVEAKLIILTLMLAMIFCVAITRLRDTLSLWLAVALLASFGDAILVLQAMARFSVGWYAGRVLSMVSSSVVLGLLIFEFSRLYERLVQSNLVLAERALHDGLTGGFNRGYLDEQLPRELRRAIRENAALSLLMIDVDYFKSYNDRFGHQSGDKALIAIVAAIQDCSRRPGDFVARYGGEEFVVVLPHTDAQGASRQANKIRMAVRALALGRDDASQDLVTVSLGAATFTPSRDLFGVEALLQYADAALYEAKHAGRDRVVAFMQDNPAPRRETKD